MGPDPKTHRTEGKCVRTTARRRHRPFALDANISVKSNTLCNLFFSIGIEKRKHEQF